MASPRLICVVVLVLMASAGLSACGHAAGSASSVIDDDVSPADDDDSPGDDDASPADDDSSPADDDVFACNVNHPDSTVGLMYCANGAFEGYTLLAPTLSTTVYLLDMYGRVVHDWPDIYMPGQVVYLLESGQLLRTGDTILKNDKFGGLGMGGAVELQNWDGSVQWRFSHFPPNYCSHHDVKLLPNGNILAIVWESKPRDQAIAAGRNPALLSDSELWPDCVLEIQPVGAAGANIVWEWHTWDHLIQDFDSTKANFGVVADHPELVDLNYVSDSKSDWMHTNAVDYREDLDQILISVRQLSEFWIIDHGTTTAEAASHSGGARGKGGDLLFRWGNPAVYRAGTPADRDFYMQHDAEWIKAGLAGATHIMVFNNGVGRPGGDYSTIDEMVPAVDENGDYPPPNPTYGPHGLYWNYTAPTPTEMYSLYMGGAQRLPNGDTLICVAGSGEFIEITPTGKMQWKYVNPVTMFGVLKQGQVITPAPGGDENEVFRAYRYPRDFPAFKGKDLTPKYCLVEPCQ